METRLKGRGTEVTISDDLPTAIIGERINPTGRKKLAAAILAGDLDMLRKEAIAQAQAGADIIDVNVGAAGADEPALLPRAVRIVMDAVDLPISIDTADGEALAAALAVHKELNPGGKALINSVNGEEASMKRVLPLAARFGTAVIALTMDENGIPETAEKRLAVAKKIVERAAAAGIGRENILVDCLALTMGADSKAGCTTLQAMRLVKQELGVNLTLGASNISFGLPERGIINSAFIAMAIEAGLNCPIVNAAEIRPYILAADLAMGRDEYATRYIRAMRERAKAQAQAGQ